MLGRYSLRIKQLSCRASFVRNASSDEIQKYRTASIFEQSERESINILQKDGRAFPAGTSMLPLYNINTAEYFPIVTGTSLEGNDVEVPDSYQGSVKLVSFSFQDYGFQLLPSWLEPFNKKYPVESTNGKVKSIQICWIKYGFLNFLNGVFVNSMKPKIDPALHNQTVLAFGKMRPFAEFLLLPSMFTGYVYLLDRNNKIRWKGSGRADPNELNVLFEHVDTLLKEPRL